MKHAIVFLFSVLLAAGAYAQTKASISGFGGVAWGATMADARKGIRAKIIYDDEKKLIVARDGEITYRYGFFYKDPDREKTAQSRADAVQPAQPAQPVQAAKPAQPAQAKATPEATVVANATGNSRFFYAISEFPYLSLDRIREKMTAQYGGATGDNIKKNQGALLWDTDKGVAIVWVDAYEKKAYCRKISYISKEIAKELNAYQEEIFNQKEREVLKNLIP